MIESARSPWELGEIWDYTSLDTQMLPAATTAVFPDSLDFSSSSMPRIVDYTPKYIEVLPDAAHDQRTGYTEMEMDMFDAILRCFKQRDDRLYNAEGRLRWRHYFETDILASIIAGCFDIDNPCMRNQFIGTHLTYDICNCSMMFFPVILHERWVCFTWNLKQNEIVVFDPACMNIPGFSIRSTYKSVVEKLKKTLSSVIPHFLPGWEHDWHTASIIPFHWRYAGITWSNRTGVLAAYFCRCFDGHQLRPEIEQGHVDIIAESLFTEVAAVHQNRQGSSPAALVDARTYCIDAIPHAAHVALKKMEAGHAILHIWPIWLDPTDFTDVDDLIRFHDEASEAKRLAGLTYGDSCDDIKPFDYSSDSSKYCAAGNISGCSHHTTLSVCAATNDQIRATTTWQPHTVRASPIANHTTSNVHNYMANPPWIKNKVISPRIHICV